MAIFLSAINKTIIEEHLLTLNRDPEYNFWFPGIYSAIVPYHDILDFYYSGHMSTSAILIYFLYGLTKEYPDVGLFYWLLQIWKWFRVPFIFIYMSALRAHFSIDFMSGFCMGIIWAMVAEKISYVGDVVALGRPAHKRGLVRYVACPSCGWSCSTRPIHLIDNEEKHI